jgi:hypothetical protein
VNNRATDNAFKNNQKGKVQLKTNRLVRFGAKPLSSGVIAICLFTSVICAYAQSPGPSPLNLGGAANFVILSKSGITDVPTSAINGNVGTSPITGAADHLKCTEVTGTIYSVNAAGPACRVIDPTRLTDAVDDMETAYTDAAGRTNPDFTELGAGSIGGMTLSPGLYKWSTGVKVPTDVTLSGGVNDIWIFQIAGNFNVSNGIVIHLTGGARAKNVFWQVGGQAVFGTTSKVAGTVLSKTLIALKTGATVHGRLLAQTAVTLQMSIVKKPTN